VAENEVIGHGFEAGTDLGTLVNIEEAVGLKDLSAALGDDRFDLSCRHSLGHQHTDIPGNCRILGDSGIVVVKSGVRDDALQVDDRDDRAPADSIGTCRIRVDLTEVSQDLILVADQGLAAGMQEGSTCLRVADHFFLHADRLEELLDHALHGEEVAFSIHAQGEHGTLVGELGERQSLRDVDVGELKQTGILIAAVVVGRKTGQHAIERSRAHHGEVLAQGIRDADRLTLGGILRKEQTVKDLRALEGIGHGLGEAVEHGDLTGLVLDAHLVGQTSHHGFAARQGHRDIFITGETGYFLGQVAHGFDILAEIRDDDFFFLRVIVHLQLRENVEHGLLIVISAEEGIDITCIEGDADAVRDGLADIGKALYGDTAAQLPHQLAGAVDRRLGVGGMKSLFKNTGRIGAEADPLGGLADIGTVEGRGLEKNGLHFVRDLGVLTAHDTCNTDLLFSVADHQDIVVHPAHLAVQGLEHVSVLRAAHDDLVSLDRIEVKGVHGLAVFDHDIVGNVDQIVDGTDPAGREPSLHPPGGGADLYILADTGCIAAAQVGVLYLDGNIIIYISLLVGCGSHIRLFKRLSKSNCRFARHAQKAVAVHAVGCDLIFKNCIPQTQELQGIHTGFHGVHCAGFLAVQLSGSRQRTGLRLCHGAEGLGEDIDAVLRSLGIGVAVASQLLDSAHHACGRNAAEFAGLDLDPVLREGTAVMSAGHTAAVQDHGDQRALKDIGGTCDDLHSLFSHIHLADDQFVRIRVLLDGQDPAYHDFFQIFVQTLDAVHLGAGHRHPVIVFLIGAFQPRYICFQP